MNAKAVPVLMYHHVSPEPGTVTVSPANFQSQMQALARSGYTTPGADHFAAFIAGQGDLPQKSVLITFDDGYLDNYVHAFPVLKRYGLNAVIFLVSGWIGDGSPRNNSVSGGTVPACLAHGQCKSAIREGRADEVMLRWSEIEAMAGTVECHSHTHSHLRWDELHSNEAERLAALGEDLACSRETLRKKLGVDSRHLCWPWGRVESGYREVARRAGFSAQYLVEPGTNLQGAGTESIRRVAAKDKGGAWLSRRTALFRRPLLSRVYLGLKG